MNARKHSCQADGGVDVAVFVSENVLGIWKRILLIVDDDLDKDRHNLVGCDDGLVVKAPIGDEGIVIVGCREFFVFFYVSAFFGHHHLNDPRSAFVVAEIDLGFRVDLTNVIVSDSLSIEGVVVVAVVRGIVHCRGSVFHDSTPFYGDQMIDLHKLAHAHGRWIGAVVDYFLLLIPSWNCNDGGHARTTNVWFSIAKRFIFTPGQSRYSSYESWQ